MSNHSRLTTAEAAEFLGLSAETLTTWRCTKRYEIPYLKVGKKVFYVLTDLETWLESRKVSPAAQEVKQ